MILLAPKYLEAPVTVVWDCISICDPNPINIPINHSNEPPLSTYNVDLMIMTNIKIGIKGKYCQIPFVLAHALRCQ